MRCGLKKRRDISKQTTKERKKRNLLRGGLFIKSTKPSPVNIHKPREKQHGMFAVAKAWREDHKLSKWSEAPRLSISKPCHSLPPTRKNHLQDGRKKDGGEKRGSSQKRSGKATPNQQLTLNNLRGGSRNMGTNLERRRVHVKRGNQAANRGQVKKDMKNKEKFMIDDNQ